MDLKSVKSSLSKQQEGNDFESLPLRFFEPFIMEGIKLQLVQPGRVVCSLVVPSRLANKDGNSVHKGSIATLVDFIGASVVHTLGAKTIGVSLEINVSYYDNAYLGEEIEIEANALQVGKVIAVVTVDLREKKTQKLIARGRHTLYMAVAISLQFSLLQFLESIQKPPFFT